MFRLGIFVVFLALTTVSARELARNTAEFRRSFTEEQEALYLPNPRAVTFFSFGYRNLLADLFWFKTISYFGKHYRTDGKYTWLAHMCDLVTTLDPKFFSAYPFCGMMLSWEAGRPDESVRLLTRGVEAVPDRWELLYQLGFTKMYFLKDTEGAQEAFVRAAAIPNAPVFLATLASKKLAALDRPDQAVAFLEQMLAVARDPTERAALEYRYLLAKNELQIFELEAAAKRFNTINGRVPTGLEQALGAPAPLDPWGHPYRLDESSLTVENTVAVRRLRPEQKTTGTKDR